MSGPWCRLGCTADVDYGVATLDRDPSPIGMVQANRQANQDRHTLGAMVHRTPGGPWHTFHGESVDQVRGQLRRSQEPGADFAYIYGIPDTSGGPWPDGDLVTGSHATAPVQDSLFELVAS